MAREAITGRNKTRLHRGCHSEKKFFYTKKKLKIQKIKKIKEFGWFSAQISHQYFVGRQSTSSIVASTLSAVIVFHSVVSGTMSAVVILHPVASRIMSAVTIFAQIAEVLCRPWEYFRSCSKYSVGCCSIPSRSIGYSIGRESTPSRSFAYFVGRHNTCAK
jgi:hypothetical protein